MKAYSGSEIRNNLLAFAEMIKETHEPICIKSASDNLTLLVEQLKNREHSKTAIQSHTAKSELKVQSPS